MHTRRAERWGGVAGEKPEAMMLPTGWPLATGAAEPGLQRPTFRCQDGIRESSHKFLIGGALVLGTRASSWPAPSKETAQYYLTPSRTRRQGRGGPVVREHRRQGRRARWSTARSIVSPADVRVSFQMTDGTQHLQRALQGHHPGYVHRWRRCCRRRTAVVPTAHFQATTLLAKCASRYENAPDGKYPAIAELSRGAPSLLREPRRSPHRT